MEIIIPDVNLATLLPEIILTTVACLALLIQVFLKGTTEKVSAAIFSTLTLAGTILAAAVLVFAFGDAPVSSFSGTWVYDDFSRLFKIIFLLGTGLTVLLSVKYAPDEGIEQGEYYAVILFATVGMMIMAGATDMITVFLGLELMSICLYILAGVVRSRTWSIEASLKYFILGSFASAFLVYGMALVYGSAASTNFAEIRAYITAESIESNPILLMGMVLMVIGFGFKVALVPFHMWTPDVYDGAPAPIAGFMSAGPKAAAFAAFARVMYEALPAMEGNWTMFLSVLAIITMTVGNVTALRQKSVKRMLAYSSVSHSGFMLIGMIAKGEEGMSSVLYYITTYTFMNIGAFAVLTLIAMKGEKRTNYEDYKGMWKTNPGLAIVMSLFLFSLAGIPPLAGFMGKFYVLMAAVKADYICLATIGVLNSAIAVYYYLRVTIMMYFSDPDEDVEPTSLTFSPAMTAALAISVAGVLVLGIIPSVYITAARSAALLIQ